MRKKLCNDTFNCGAHQSMQSYLEIMNKIKKLSVLFILKMYLNFPIIFLYAEIYRQIQVNCRGAKLFRNLRIKMPRVCVCVYTAQSRENKFQLTGFSAINQLNRVVRVCRAEAWLMKHPRASERAGRADDRQFRRRPKFLTDWLLPPFGLPTHHLTDFHANVAGSFITLPLAR